MRTVLTALFASVVLGGCVGFEYRSPNHPAGSALVQIVVVGRICDLYGYCQPVYGYVTDSGTVITTQSIVTYYYGANSACCYRRPDGKWWRW